MKQFLTIILIIGAFHFTFGQYRLNGSSVRDTGECFTITPDQQWRNGSIWYLNKVDISRPFDLYFDVFMGCRDANGADGLAFVLQQVSTRVGTSGGGLGYLGISPSIAVELDGFQNGDFGDPFYDHLAIMKNGNPRHNSRDNLAGPVSILPNNRNAEDCQFHSLRITWDPANTVMRVYLDCQLRLSYTGDIVRDIFNNDSQVFWGFTGATGFYTNRQVFCRDYVSFFQSSQDTFICKGQSIQLDVGSGDTIRWAPTTGLSNPNIANPVASPDSSITYIARITDQCGDQRVDTIRLEVKPLPVANAGLDLLSCEGQPVQLQASGGETYQWTPAGPLNAANVANPIATPTFTRPFTVQVTDSFGCSSTDRTLVTVIYADAGPDREVCIGDTVQLSAQSGVQWRWQPDPTLINTTSATPSVFPLQSQSYVAEITDATGCVGLDTVEVTVNPLPTVTATQPEPYVCSGGDVQLTATGGVSFLWQPGNTLDDSTLAQPIARPVNTNGQLVDSAFYFVTVTDTNGCVNNDSLGIEVRIRPIITVSPDTFVCPGDSVQLAVAGGIQRFWQSSPTLNDTSLDFPWVFPDRPSTYVATVVAVWGCDNTDSVQVHVQVANAGADTLICSGDTIQLQGASQGSRTFDWSPKINLLPGTDGTAFVWPDSSQAYLVEILDSLGCRDVDTVVVNTRIPPTANAGPDWTICEQDSIQLAGSGGLSFAWTPEESLSNDSVPFPIATPTSTTIYTLTVRDNLGCRDQDSTLVTVLPRPEVEAGPDLFGCRGDTLTLLGSGANLYEWEPNFGLSDPQVASPLFIADSNRTLILKGTGVNGCQNEDTVNVRVWSLPEVELSGLSPICRFESSVIIAAQSAAYRWSTGALTDKIEVAPFETTQYWVIGRNDEGCFSDTAFYTLEVLDRPSAEAELLPSAGFAPLEVQGIYIGEYASRFRWVSESGEIQPTSAFEETYTVPGIYQVEFWVDNEGRCPDSSTYTIEVWPPRMFLPNAFSPNNDGHNDVFAISGGGWSGVTLEIFNRWGRLVHQAWGENASWNGAGVPEGVYVYKVRGQDTEGKIRELSGTVTLIR
ncbi:MAG: gliding motility-associated C-terminal domain-containing protein [Bacteroidota bacterium]